MPICKFCNTEFVASHHNHTTFCSHKCSYSFYNKQISEDTNKRARARQLGIESYHRKKHDPKNIVYFMLRHAKARAAKKNLAFNIDETDIILPEYCPVLKVKLTKNDRRYGYSLDRIDPKKGYTKGNVQVISQQANAMKWDSTLEERLAFANWVLDSGKEGN